MTAADEWKASSLARWPEYLATASAKPRQSIELRSNSQWATTPSCNHDATQQHGYMLRASLTYRLRRGTKKSKPGVVCRVMFTRIIALMATKSSYSLEGWTAEHCPSPQKHECEYYLAVRVIVESHWRIQVYQTDNPSVMRSVGHAAASPTAYVGRTR